MSNIFASFDPKMVHPWRSPPNQDGLRRVLVWTESSRKITTKSLRENCMVKESSEEILALIDEQAPDPELYQRLGRAYTQEHRREEARAAFERSLALDPHDVFTHLYLGNWFYTSGMYPQALARFRDGVRLMPDAAISHRCLGDAYQAMEQDHLAEQAYEKALNVEPDDTQALQKLAFYRKRGKVPVSLTRDMIRAAYRKNQPTTCVLLASRWLRDHPDDIRVIDDYAEMLYRMTRYEEAIQVYLDAIERFPDKRWALYNQLGHLYDYRGDFALAEQWHQKATEVDPDEVSSYVFLGGVQARQGRLTDAEATHRRGTQCLEGPVDEAYLNLGLVLRGQGRLAEAADAFRKAIELCPNYPEAVDALEDVETALALSADDS
jgi:tetratricopeptide (TPR) repeat protein